MYGFRSKGLRVKTLPCCAKDHGYLAREPQHRVGKTSTYKSICAAAHSSWRYGTAHGTVGMFLSFRVARSGDEREAAVALARAECH